MHEVKEHCDLLKKDGKMVEEIKRAEKKRVCNNKGCKEGEWGEASRKRQRN